MMAPMGQEQEMAIVPEVAVMAAVTLVEILEVMAIQVIKTMNQGITTTKILIMALHIDLTNMGCIHQVIAGGAFYMLPGKLQAYRGTLNNNDLNFKASFDLFKFLACHTDVEWAFSYNGKDEKNKEGYGFLEGVINTSHNQSSGDSIYVSGMDNFVHSHPNDFAEPSESDISTGVGMYKASNIKNAQYAYANFKIYLPHIGVDGEVIDFTDEVISASKASNHK